MIKMPVGWVGLEPLTVGTMIEEGDGTGGR